jgi:hypothetical protein
MVGRIVTNALIVVFIGAIVLARTGLVFETAIVMLRRLGWGALVLVAIMLLWLLFVGSVWWLTLTTKRRKVR